MTELETAIRDALHARAEEAPIRHTTLIARRKPRWFAPLLAAALVIGLVALTLVLVSNANTTTPPAGPKASSFVGYSWRLVQIDDAHGRLILPSRTKAEVDFGGHGLMTGDDTVHTLQARYRVVAPGYEPGQVTTSANGLGGHVSVALKRTLGAIGSCFSSPAPGSKPPRTTPIAATVDGDRLTLHTSDGVLTFVRNGTVVELKG